MSHTPQLDQLVKRLGLDLPAIERARVDALDWHDRLSKRLELINSSDTSVVAFGSLARLEWTVDSDVDWTLLVDGIVDNRHFRVVRRIQDELVEEKAKKPGREGLFGNMAYSHGIVHHIGGEQDTNRNITQRILLLLESRPIGRYEAYERVVRSIVDRYVMEDRGLLYGSGRHGVPRFLLNDIVRYWRTMAVDYAYKQRERDGAGLPLRNFKLRMSRKLIFVAGLLTCFLCNTPEIKNHSGSDKAKLVQGRLLEFVHSTPLEILAVGLDYYMVRDELIVELLRCYENFLSFMSDSRRREELERLSVDDIDSSSISNTAREIARRFDEALIKMFFDTQSLRPMITKFGVF